jgi:hypothetical protein
VPALARTVAVLLDIDCVISADLVGRSDDEFELALPVEDAYVPRGLPGRRDVGVGAPGGPS